MIRCAAFLLITCFILPTRALPDDKVQCPPFSFSPTADTKQDPQTFAWDLFAYVNQKVTPADPGSAVLWETWASPQDLYCHDGMNCDPHKRPPWPDHRAHIFKPGPMLETDMLIHQAVFSKAPEVPGPGGEIRINCGTFKHIADNYLWYLEGQERAFQSGKEIGN